LQQRDRGPFLTDEVGLGESERLETPHGELRVATAFPSLGGPARVKAPAIELDGEAGGAPERVDPDLTAVGQGERLVQLWARQAGGIAQREESLLELASRRLVDRSERPSRFRSVAQPGRRGCAARIASISLRS